MDARTIFENAKQAALTQGKQEFVRQVREANTGILGDLESKSPDDHENASEDTEDSIPLDEQAFYFEEPDKAINLAAAVAAYRAVGGPDHCIFWHTSGIAGMCLTEDANEEIDEYIEANQIKGGDWKSMTDCSKIMALDYDDVTLAEIADENCEPEEDTQEAARNYEAFNWDHKQYRRSTMVIPGIADGVVLYELGNCLMTDYESDKDGGKGGKRTIEYTHTHGPGTLPKLLAINDNVLVIFGGNMKVTPAGIAG